MAGRLFFLALGLAAAAAHAQSPDAGLLDLPPVLVLPPADEVVPTASSPLMRDAAGAVTVVDATQRHGEAKDVAALVAEVPGAHVQDTGGAGQKKALSLRGATSNGVLVLLDGVPLATPGTAVDLSLVPAAVVQRIEVLRGPGASRWGPHALGGVVDLVTRKARGTQLFGEATRGSFGTTQLSVGGAAPVAGGEALVLLHGLTSAGDFPFELDEKPTLEGGLVTRIRQNNDALQGGGLLRFRRGVGDSTLELVAQGAATGRGLAGTMANPTTDARQRAVDATLSARWVTPFASGGELSVLGFGHTEDGTLTGSPFGGGDYRQLASGAGAEVVVTKPWGRHGVTALVAGGGDWLVEPTHANPASANLGAMLADEVRFFDDALAVDASARVDVSGPFTVFSPKVGAALELPWGLSLRANAGQLARTPSFLELNVVQGTLLPNPDLRPERALTADAAVAWETERARVTVTGFASLVEDLITYEYYPPTLAKPYNILTALVRGVEVEGRFTPFEGLSATLAYTFLDTANLRDDPRYYLKPLPLRPPHHLVARLQGGPRWLFGHAELDLTSDQPLNRTGTLSLPGRALVNLGVASRPLPRADVAVAVELRNLLDVHSQDLDGYPLPPRALYLTLTAAWEAAPPQRPHAPASTL